MAWPGGALLALLVAAAVPRATAARAVATSNPIRRVVTMLQMMQEKVTFEGQKEEKLFEQFMCHCDSSETALQKSIGQAETKLPELESSIKESQAEAEHLKADLGDGKTDLQEAEEALQQNQQISEKEHQGALKEISDTQSNIKALDKAIKALEKGSSGAFLQTSAAATLRQLSVSMDMSTSDRDMISAFLSQGQTDSADPRSSEVVGILKQMQEEMMARLAEVQEQDAVAMNQTADMVKAKTEQITALKRQINSKTGRLGELAVDTVNLQADLDDTSKSLEQDRKFLAVLQAGCSKKKAEWTEREKTRAQELQAITATIKVLNDDEALTLFKKTLPSPSFLQVQSNHRRGVQQQALRALQAAKRAGRGQHGSRLDLVAMALRAKKASFFKVIKMIDDMIALLAKEQTDDAKKKDYCKSELDQSAEAIQEAKLDISDMGKAIEEAKQKIATLTEEVGALSQGIQQLDKQVADSTTQRKEEHADYVEKLGTNSATQELLQTAKKILNKFYNPKLAAAESSESQDQGNFFAQLSDEHAGRAPDPAPPETWSGEYKKETEAYGGVIEMLDQLSEDLAKDTQELQVNEKNGQAQYEEAMKDATAKRASDARVISEKEAVKAEIEARLHKMNQERKSKVKEHRALKEYAKDMHSACDWLLENFDVRKEARANEVESLHQAKAVLSGASYS
uniref:Uncharacterized protein n=1 Tax=Alexandrium monilatum TaxID=311494 RepID=A0A7S4SG50_9DINO